MQHIRRLADYPYVLVRLRCEVCNRAGAYRLARLAVKFGAEILLDDLILRLSADCPWRDEARERAARGFVICRQDGRPIYRGRRCASLQEDGGSSHVRPVRDHDAPGCNSSIVRG